MEYLRAKRSVQPSEEQRLHAIGAATTEQEERMDGKMNEQGS